MWPNKLNVGHKVLVTGLAFTSLYLLTVTGYNVVLFVQRQRSRVPAPPPAPKIPATVDEAIEDDRFS